MCAAGVDGYDQYGQLCETLFQREPVGSLVSRRKHPCITGHYMHSTNICITFVYHQKTIRRASGLGHVRSLFFPCVFSLSFSCAKRVPPWGPRWPKVVSISQQTRPETKIGQICYDLLDQGEGVHKSSFFCIISINKYIHMCINMCFNI